MAAAVIQEPEAPEAARITQVEDLPDLVRADIVARRQAGETLAELKSRFSHVDPAVIREVLPPANARERNARKVKDAPAEVDPDTQKPSKAAPTPRYTTEVGDLPERAVAARQVVGRTKLAELLGVTGSAVWRFEHGRVHPTELGALKNGLTKVEERIAAGEFVKPEREVRPKAITRAESE